MLKTIGLICLLGTAAMPAWANFLVYQGTFIEDDNVALLPFTLAGNDLVTIQSYGYAGGTAPGGTVIPSGGFPTTVVLFDGAGHEIGSDNGGHCAITGADSVTQNCADGYFQDFLSAGSYIVALIESDNVPNGDLSDGFRQDGNPGFTCAEFGQSGNFCDTTVAAGNVVRNGNYAVAISGDTLVTSVTPEPSSLILINAAGVLAAVLRLRKKL